MNNLRPGKTIELMTRPGSNDTSAIISLITVSLSAPLSLGGPWSHSRYLNYLPCLGWALKSGGGDT